MPGFRSIKQFFLFTVFVLESTLFGLCDLEDQIQDFVVETKQIIIPGFPHAFNPSIVRWNNSLLMSFRYIAQIQTKSTRELHGYISCIGLVWLDNNFNPIGNAQLLNLSHPGQITKGREEDARLVIANNRLYVVYSDNKEIAFSDAGFRVYTVEISYDGHQFYVSNHQACKNFEGENPKRREKNWTPFECDGQLHFAYTINPHLIFKPIPGTDQCETVAKTYSELPWQWGDPRGGTPALKINEDEYLSFFHSLCPIASLHSKGQLIDHYFIGAYTFSTSYPYQMTRISPEPIVGVNFYHGTDYKFYWKPVVVVFPCGFIHDKNFIWVCYGRQDHEIWLAKIDKQAFLDSLLPVSSNA